jgi:ABC-2 type transport system ATP-binding protein
MALIELDGVEKTFVVRVKRGRLRRERKRVEAVAGVSFEIERGSMVGYVGPNGAGKSTTVKMLTGILVPSAGRIRVAGFEPSRQRVQLARRIGVVFGQRVQLWWDLPLRDSFELLRHVYRVPAARHRENLEAFTEVLELAPFLDTPVRQLSLGQRMRGELTAAMLHDPEILFLDEPTIGLDVVAKARVREFLAAANAERGMTVLLTTHDLSDIERLCPRMLIIDHGRVIYDGGIEALKARFGEERTLIVDLEEPAPPLEIEGARVVRVEGVRQWLVFRREEVTAAELTAAVAARAALVDLAIEEPDIEDVVRRIYVGGLADDASVSSTRPAAAEVSGADHQPYA